MRDVFFLVVGSRACAHLLLHAADTAGVAGSRFGSAILDDRDLSEGAETVAGLDAEVARLLAHRPEIRLLFLVGSCPSEGAALDLRGAAIRLDTLHAPHCRVLFFSGAGITTTATEGEDACLASMVPALPAGAGVRLLLVGALPGICLDQALEMLGQIGIADVGLLPSRRASEPPQVGARTRFVCLQPFLEDTGASLIRRGAQPISAPSPVGGHDSTAWFHAIASTFDIDPARVEQVVALPRARAQAALSRAAAPLAGRSVEVQGQGPFEIMLARFLGDECGMQVIGGHARPAQSGSSKPRPETPYRDDGDATALPDLTVCATDRVTVCDAMGRACITSLDCLLAPIHFFDHAADLARLFADVLRRHPVATSPGEGAP